MEAHSHPLRLLRNLRRTREIATVLLQYGFGDLVERLRLSRYVQWGKRMLLRQKQAPPAPKTRAERIRLALESLGPTFIKFGQVASTRPDLLPPDVIAELERLQENVPPFPSEQAVAVVEKELGAPIEKLFAEFHPEPIAAASLAQVHEARHRNGQRLAVKIRRPGVVREVERDIALMRELAILAERHIPEAAVLDPVGLVDQFARTIRREMDFLREARTLEEFQRLFRRDESLYVPTVDWELTSESILTMEFVDGLRADDPEELRAHGISPRQVAVNGSRIYMRMAFEFGIFHGDPHPGNIRILRDGVICLLDYGMIGMLDEEKREGLVDLFVGIINQDVAGVVDTVLDLGQPFRPIDEPLLRGDVRDFVETYYGLSLERIRVDRMLSDFVSILSRHGIRCPPDLMLLIRALVTLEGVGRKLDPDFNLAEELAPFVQRIVRERYNPRNIAGRVSAEMRTLAKLARNAPRHAGRVLEKLSKDELQVRLEHGRIDRLITELDRSSNRIAIGMVLSALIVASALIIRTGGDVLWFSVPMFVLSSLLGIWLIYGIFRSGQL